eukprot:6196489-Pleurochrysis_carterae.AAC.3
MLSIKELFFYVKNDQNCVVISEEHAAKIIRVCAYRNKAALVLQSFGVEQSRKRGRCLRNDCICAYAVHRLLHVTLEATRAQLLLKAQLLRRFEAVRAMPVAFLRRHARKQLLHRRRSMPLLTLLTLSRFAVRVVVRRPTAHRFAPANVTAPNALEPRTSLLNGSRREAPGVAVLEELLRDNVHEEAHVPGTVLMNGHLDKLSCELDS